MEQKSREKVADVKALKKVIWDMVRLQGGPAPMVWQSLF